MAHPSVIASIAALERESALAALEDLLSSLPEGEVEGYASRFPDAARLSGAGDLLRSLQRVRTDVGARGDADYALSVMLSAASQILERQEDRIAHLEAELEALRVPERRETPA